MKKNIILSLSASLLLAPALPVFAQQWEPVGTPGFSSSGLGVCNWQNIKFSKKNELYISFNDEGYGLNNGQGAVMKFDNGTWKSVGTSGFTAGIAHHSSFALGGGDTVYFSYSDGSRFSVGGVMMYDGTQWREIGVNMTQGACQYSSIVTTKTGEVYFSAKDMALNEVVVKKYNGNNSWSVVGSGNTVSTGGASYPFMTLDNNDVLHIAYQDLSSPPGMVRVKRFDGSAWVNVGNPFLSVTGGGASPAMDICIAFSPENKIYVAYSHGFQGPPRSSVQMFDGNNWVVVGTPQFAGGPGAPSLFNSLAFDKQGTPYLAFQNYGIGMKASVMKFDGTSWVYVGGQSVSEDVAAHTSIAMDGNGNPHVLFFDQKNGLKNTVMKLTVCEAPGLPDLTASETDVCIGDSILLSATGVLNDATKWVWYSGSCEGTEEGEGSEIYVNPMETTTYFARGLGGCVGVGDCRAVTINVNPSRDLNVFISVEGFELSTAQPYSTYQWIYNDEVIAGATNSTLQVTKNGAYRVAVSNQNGCVDTSDAYTITNVSIQNADDRSRQTVVYPNPAKEWIHIQAPFPVQVTMTSIDGKAVRTILKGHTLSVKDLAAGMYLLRITDEQGSFNKVEKIIIAERD